MSFSISVAPPAGESPVDVEILYQRRRLGHTRTQVFWFWDARNRGAVSFRNQQAAPTRATVSSEPISDR
jgi:hypothetical protein